VSGSRSPLIGSGEPYFPLRTCQEAEVEVILPRLIQEDLISILGEPYFLAMLRREEVLPCLIPEDLAGILIRPTSLLIFVVRASPLI